MARSRELKGSTASSGTALGPAFLAKAQQSGYQTSYRLAEETRRLQAAIRQASAELVELAATLARDVAAILDYQIEVLDDAEFIAMALHHVANGADAASAWTAALDDVIALTDSSDYEDLWSRSIDTVDVRNRVLAILCGELPGDFPPGSIYIGDDMTPSLFLTHDWSAGGGIVLWRGSATSHVAMLARAARIPMLVAVGHRDIAEGDPVLLQAEAGFAILHPDAETVETYGRDNADTGVRPVNDPDDQPLVYHGARVQLLANISNRADLQRLDWNRIDGIGLVRTEFLLQRPSDLAAPERHLEHYAALIAAAGGKPVTIRLLDFGGDKPLADGPQTASPSHALGLRGIRWLLAEGNLLQVQIEALLKAGALGPVKVLIPMVSLPSEIDTVRSLFLQAARRLGLSQTAMPEIGIMVEVPAVALMLERFASADFFSIGSNDLTQFLSGAARDNQDLAAHYADASSAVISLIGMVVAKAGSMGKTISLCGDIAGDLAATDKLLAAGLRSFSVAPVQLQGLRRAIQSAGHCHGA